MRGPRLLEIESAPRESGVDSRLPVEPRRRPGKRCR